MIILDKMYKIIPFLLALALVGVSCTDDEKDKFQALTKDGAFVRFANEIPPIAVGVENISDVEYSFELSDPNNNVANYDLSVYAILGGTSTDTLALTQVNQFPSELSFTIDDLTSTIGINVEDVSFGDQFGFIGVSTNLDGVVYSNELLVYEPVYDEETGLIDSYELSGGNTTEDLLVNDGYKQAYNFDFIILCPDPFTAEDFAGTWQITNDPFETTLDDGIFEIIEGPGENQVTMLDPFGHVNPDTGETYDVIIDFDPDSGELIVERQAAWHCDNFGCAFGEGRIDGTGFVFICADLVKLSLEHTVDAGSFGTFALDLVKL